MINFPPRMILAAAIASVVLTPVQAAESIAEAFENGKTDISFRLRYEDVNDDGATDAEALTLKSRITFTTDSYKGVSALLEVDDVTALDNVDYTDGVTVRGTTPIVDPEDTDVNQAYLAYSTGATTVKLGRQRILLDNQRFVGGVGFRQNEQTYDAVTVTNKSLSDTTLFYGYISSVNGITGTDTEHETHLVNAKYTGLPIGALSAYYYSVELEDADDSLDTYGVRLSGSQPAGDAKLLYTAEYATQENVGGTAEPDYYVLEGGVSIAGVTAKLGYEVLGSDEGVGFNTPLATKHKFQGWADMFLGTPGAGIEDTYVTVATKLAGIKLMAVYHDYESEEGSLDFGDEWGFVAAKKFGKNYGLSLKYASYDAGDDIAKADKSKLWLTATAKF
ncbi:alginate export family protein [Pontibacter sp. JAM-7]|uniref:alginate export family protein n=1 Tax=Pontibacter sp. JAM-7 TaxID=3366581 RepID=UPI003AF47465